MTKYIVKNCPCYELENCNCEHLEHKYCDDCADCPIKQVAKISSEYYDVYCNHCVTKNCDGCHFDLAKQILQTLQVEEVK